MSALLPAERLECQVLQACDFALEQADVHDGLASVVFLLDVLHPGTFDAEDHHPPAVHAPDLDVAQLATAHEPEGAQEEILGLEHRRLLQSHAHGLPEESWIRLKFPACGSDNPK